MGYTYGRDNPLQKINFTFQKLVPRTSSFGGNLVVERVARTSWARVLSKTHAHYSQWWNLVLVVVFVVNANTVYC